MSRILIVEDDADMANLALRWLERAGHTVARTSDGAAGLKMLEADPLPDLVLLDVMMPGTEGPTTLQRMRADPRLANIPVVFVTAKAMPAEVARFRELGAVAVIAKPFDPMQFGQQIVTIWEGIDHGRA
jgi:two-component system OmpR family response regulator